MPAIREFPSVSVNNNNNVIQVNTNDSNFAVVPGSVIFITGDRPRVVTSGDTTNRTLTLAIPYTGTNIVEKSATLIPLGQNAALLSAMTSLTEAQNGLAEAYGNGPGTVGEISFSMITDPPQTATQWPTWSQVQGDIEEVLPETATRFPTFPEIEGKVSVEQLPDNIDTDNKRTQALSPPVRQNPSLTHILSDYPKLIKTVDIPEHSPNNRREMLFDDVRQTAYIALTEEYLKVPNVIATREFLMKFPNRRIWFNSAYTGDITLRLYPMGRGNASIPNAPELEDFKWHTITINVSGISSFGTNFVGIIDYMETSDGYETFSSNQSHFHSINAYFGDTSGNVANSQFRTFSLRQDGYWYSSDVLPTTLYYLGGSWTQDGSDFRTFHVNNASGSTDALRPFDDGWDDYEFEMILVTDIPNPMATTIGNNADTTAPFEGTYRFVISQDRIYFKRQASFAPLTGTVRIESLRIRVKHYE